MCDDRQDGDEAEMRERKVCFPNWGSGHAAKLFIPEVVGAKDDMSPGHHSQIDVVPKIIRYHENVVIRGEGLPSPAKIREWPGAQCLSGPIIYDHQ